MFNPSFIDHLLLSFSFFFCFNHWEYSRVSSSIWFNIDVVNIRNIRDNLIVIIDTIVHVINLLITGELIQIMQLMLRGKCQNILLYIYVWFNSV